MIAGPLGPVHFHFKLNVKFLKFVSFSLQIPVDKNGKLRALELRGMYSRNLSKYNIVDASSSNTDNTRVEIPDNSQCSDTKTKNESKDSIFCKNYASFIPKMSLKLEKVVEKNPRILDLREKLNEITRKRDSSVDKKTKALINDITQLVDKREEDESGPYSLLFDLQSDPSTSIKQSSETDVWNKARMEAVSNQDSLKKTKAAIMRSAERLPNVINFDDKPMREFEYSCENEFDHPVKKVFNTHSRSDLCLQLKSHVQSRTLETNLSPSDNSMSRANEENSLDDSLGILTPDQMDDICYLENAFSPTVEGLPIFCDSNKISPDNGDTPSTDKTESNSAASTIQNDGFDSTKSKKMIEESLAPVVSMEAIMHNVDQLTLQSSDQSASKPTEVRHAQEGSIAFNVKEGTINKADSTPNLEEELMPSIHSSILEPVSSMTENIINLELPLDCKHESIIITTRIEETPSPEDLPLDSSDINGEISTYSQFSAATLHDSQTYSDSKTDYTKSMETSKVSNSFITSITSITSLDGYQGDGEMSRPVSRGADHSINREDVIEMDWQNVPVTRRADPMTDSDFFTESDADGLDDHMQRGDRRAQVIDGALYGGKNGNGNPPLIVNRNEDSCMESSGVYTDFENHRSSPVFMNVIDDMSPEGSSPSTRSECSQKNSTGNINAFFNDTLIEQKCDVSLIPDQEETPKNTSKRNSLNSEKDGRNSEKKEEKRFTLKKYKMPKRDVPSKLKSMLANRKAEGDNSVQSSPKSVKKPDRRENITKKNSLEIKGDYKVKSYKDIKSKVDCSFSLQRSQTSCSVNRMLSSKSTNTNLKPKR